MGHRRGELPVMSVEKQLRIRPLPVSHCCDKPSLFWSSLSIAAFPQDQEKWQRVETGVNLKEPPPGIVRI